MAVHIDAVQPATDEGDENDEEDREKGGKPVRPEASIQVISRLTSLVGHVELSAVRIDLAGKPAVELQQSGHDPSDSEAALHHRLALGSHAIGARSVGQELIDLCRKDALVA